MSFDTLRRQIEADPHYCRYCNKITDFVFQVAKNTAKGQYQGFVCPGCQRYKNTRFIPYKDKKAHDRVWERDYRRSNFQGYV